MSLGRTIEESLLKAIRSLEIKACHVELDKFKNKTVEELIDIIKEHTDERIFAICEAFRKGVTIDEIYFLTKNN